MAGATSNTQTLPARGRLGQLWQAPLLLLSLGLFAYAAYIFIDPQPGPTADQKIAVARAYLDQDRPDAAIERLNDLLQAGGLDDSHQSQIHLMLAESLEDGQRQRQIDVPANHLRIVEQTRLALGRGAEGSADLYRRLADSYAALGQTADAVEAYRRAIALSVGVNPADGKRGPALALHRTLIELLLKEGDAAPAEGELATYLDAKDLTNAERAWALGERANLLADAEKFTQARVLLDEALRLATDPVEQGVVNYHLGYCAHQLGDDDQAERYLRVAREQMGVRHPADADACLLLGQILQGRESWLEAISFYQIVLTSHPDSAAVPLAQLGRGVCRVMAGEDDKGLDDLRQLALTFGQHRLPPPVVEKAVSGLQTAGRTLRQKGAFAAALEAMALERTLLDGHVPGDFYARLGLLYERRAAQLDDQSAAAKDPAEKVKLASEARTDLSKAGDAYVAHAKGLVASDDAAYGDALWKGIDLYDRAADAPAAIAAMELFAAERPSDTLAPDALLRLGKLYQSAGDFDRAAATFRRNQEKYPQSLAASKSAVPLAMAYLAKGPEEYPKVEATLRGVVENNPLLTPESEEFRQAVLELGQLYYRTGRYDEAVAKFQEFAQRYPSDPRLGRVLYLTADAWRKGAAALDERVAKLTSADQTGGKQAAALKSEKADRLGRAGTLYDQTVDFYRAATPTADLDKLYEKLAHFYRADCLFDLGKYDEAIKGYERAVFKYQDDPRAVGAYVQIINANLALGRTEEAKAANERAKWIVRRIPAEAFADAGVGSVMPREYWEKWLDWAGGEGIRR